MQVFGAGSSGLPKLAELALSGASGAEFTDLDLSGVLALYLDGLTLGTTAQKFCLRFSHDNGSNYGTSGYGYDRRGIDASQSNSSSEIQITGNMTTNVASVLSGFIWIFPQAGQDRRRIIWALSGNDGSDNVGEHSGIGHSYNPSGEGINAVMLYASSGNISGNIELLRAVR